MTNKEINEKLWEIRGTVNILETKRAMKLLDKLILHFIKEDQKEA
jgi:hypothetical protein